MQRKLEVSERDWIFYLLGLLVGLLLGWVLTLSPAHAHDPDTGESNWINDGDYKSPQTGVHCCGPKDCDRLDAAHVHATPKGYVLDDFGGEVVPYAEATPSEDGKYWRCHGTVIWELDGTKGGSERRCFFAPTGTQ